MDALIPAFVVAGLAEIGDRTQILAMLLAIRFGRPLAVLAGIAVAAAINMALAVAAGHAAAHAVPHDAMRLMVGIALLLAGAGGWWRVKPPPPVDRWRIGAFASAAGAFFILEFGDKTQFVAFALGGAGPHPVLVAAGAAAGVVAANTPAVLLGAGWQGAVPLGTARRVIGAALVVAGLIVAARALAIL